MGVKNRKKEREKGLFLSWERMKGNQKKKKPLENAIMGGRNGSTGRSNPNLSVLPRIK